MKFCRFLGMEGSRYGYVETIDGRDYITSELASPQMQVSAAGVPELVVMAALGSGKVLDAPFPLERAKLLTPFPIISKILCVGRNYVNHIRELGHEIPADPTIFSKPPSSLLAPGGEIVRPRISQRVDFEAELAFIVGRRCRNMRADEHASDYILGYTALNDVTARDLQTIDGQWTRCKGFDTFCPMGPIVNTELDLSSGIQLETRVNGELRQQGNTRDMLFDIDRILRHISQFCTLLPGDLIATGTPEGVGPILAGDVVEVTVEGIGTLRNPVIDEPAQP